MATLRYSGSDTITIMQHLMDSEGYDAQEAREALREMRLEVLNEGADPEELLYDIGLEPDYIFGLIPASSLS